MFVANMNGTSRIVGPSVSLQNPTLPTHLHYLHYLPNVRRTSRIVGMRSKSHLHDGGLRGPRSDSGQPARSSTRRTAEGRSVDGCIGVCIYVCVVWHERVADGGGGVAR